jgi:hypothetical protein
VPGHLGSFPARSPHHPVPGLVEGRRPEAAATRFDRLSGRKRTLCMHVTTRSLSLSKGPDHLGSAPHLSSTGAVSGE